MAAPPIKGKTAYFLYHGFWSGVDLLFPPRCAGCQTLGDRWCAACASQVEEIEGILCPRCGRVLSSAGECRQCQIKPPLYTALRSWAWYKGSLRNALHQLKYQRNLALGEMLAQPLYGILKREGWPVDFIVSTPISVERKVERGYNQTTFITLPLAFRCRIAYRPKALAKIQETRSQVGLSVTERQENVKNAFQANPEIVRGKRVLLVDDLVTTGATLSACAAALLAGGAMDVYCLTVARAPLEIPQKEVKLV